MQNPTVELLDRLALWLGRGEKVSDYRLAKDYFKLTPQKVSLWRCGSKQFGTDWLFRVVEDLWPNDDAAKQYWLCRVQSWREKNESAKAVWERLAKQVAVYGLAGSVALTGFAPSPAQASSANAASKFNQSIYYAHLRRRSRLRPRTKLAKKPLRCNRKFKRMQRTELDHKLTVTPAISSAPQNVTVQTPFRPPLNNKQETIKDRGVEMIGVRQVQPNVIWVLDDEENLCVVRTIEQLSDWLGVGRAQIKRWCNGAVIPGPARRALAYLLGRFANPEFSGFHVGDDGKLWCPNGVGISPGELENVGIIYQTNNELWRKEIEKRNVDAGPSQKPRPLRSPYSPASVWMREKSGNAHLAG